jgi:hypothetical protein
VKPFCDLPEAPEISPQFLSQGLEGRATIFTRIAW